MKKPAPPFATQYPYLSYWIEDWGEMQTTNGDYDSRLTLSDEGGTCYEDEGSKTIDEAFAKAEKYLREVESERFDKASKESLEEDYQTYGLE